MAYRDITETMVNRIGAAIRNKIINLELSLGSRIDIKKLEMEFGVSQTPIRDAINRLIKDGLITERPRRGYYVIDIKAQDMAEIYDLREMIECYALEKGINNINSEEVEILLNSAIEMQKEPVQPRKPKKFRVADKELHRLIVKSCPNKRLYNLYLQIHHFVEISQQLDPLYERSMQEHIELMQSILKKDTQKSMSILRTHIRNCKIDGIRALQKDIYFITNKKN